MTSRVLKNAQKQVDAVGPAHTFATAMTLKPRSQSMRARVAIKPCDGKWYSVALPRRASDREGEST
jgi:hypothetical protein